MDGMTDELFARAFERGEVTPAQFDHRAHLRVAWVYLREAVTRDEALDRMRAAIRRFAAAAGASHKFHETITIAWMVLLAQARPALTSESELADAVTRYPALGDKDLPLRFYSRARLFSDAAREGWVPPDLGPLAVDIDVGGIGSAPRP